MAFIIIYLFFFNVTSLVSGDLLFKKLRSYVLTETQLVDNGYPRPAPGKPGQAVVKWSHYDKIPETKGVYVRSAAFRMLSIVVCLVQTFCSYLLILKADSDLGSRQQINTKHETVSFASWSDCVFIYLWVI